MARQIAGRAPDEQGSPAAPGYLARLTIRRDLVVGLATLASAGLVALVPNLGLPSALRETVVLLYCVSVPGWSWVRLLRIDRLELVVATSLALSVTMLILVSIVLLDAGAWHSFGAFYIVLALTALGAGLGLARR